jgi:hypothetical protein
MHLVALNKVHTAFAFASGCPCLQGKRPAYTAAQQSSSDDDSLDSEDSSDSDEIQEDYLANLQGSSDAMNSDDLQVWYTNALDCLCPSNTCTALYGVSFTDCLYFTGNRMAQAVHCSESGAANCN